MKAFDDLERAVKNNLLPEDFATLAKSFLSSYQRAAFENGADKAAVDKILQEYITLSLEEIKEPYPFPPFHPMQKKPYDFNLFGKTFIEMLIEKKRSKLFGNETLQAIDEITAKGENAVLFANHQIEADPQVIQLMIGQKHERLSDEMIFVAGHRVTTDPFAIPFSRGCNLICIYSKKRIEFPPEKRAEKLAHNHKSVQIIGQLLSEGGKCIYVAPSGGRDRKNEVGELSPALFDPDSVELFRLLGKKSACKTHFFPLSLYTYPILPPPEGLEKSLSEVRQAGNSPVKLFFGSELDLENYPGHDLKDRTLKRKQLSDFVWQSVKNNYDALHQNEFNI